MITDDDGRYEFNNLMAGGYQLSAYKEAYVGLSYGQTRPFEPGTPLEILDHQTLEKVDFVLPRGSVVTGRIFDEFGEPLSEVNVSVQRSAAGVSNSQLVQAGGATTNDIGEFRIYGLQPGQYYVLATWRHTGADISTDHTGYAPTYYPGTTLLAGAQRINVGLGEIVGNVTMPLSPVKIARISGTAVDSEGRPMRGSVSAAPVKPTGPSGYSASAVRADGSFSIPGLAPGDYTLQAREFSQPDGEVATATVTVSSEDVTDLRLIGGKPPIVRGRLIVDSAALPSLPSGLTLYMSSLERQMFGGANLAPVADDLTFELRGNAGRAQVALGGRQSGWIIRAVRYKGLDVTDSGIGLAPNTEIEGVEVELTNRLTAISGSVTNTRNEPVSSFVMLFSQDPAQWEKTSRYNRTLTSDRDGRFTVTAIPPGDYYIVAIERIDGSRSSDADFLERIRGDATTFSINEGETKTFDLRVVPGPRE